jgi:hypothetical protein
MNTDTRLASMTLDQVRAAAPSVFANHPWEGVSERYAFIPTSSVVESLVAEGWNIAAARQQRVLLQDRREFTRHMLRFRRDDALALAVGDVFPEIALTNSHDRGSAYRMDAGLFRLVCTNGLVVDDATFARLSIRHTGNVLDDVRKGADDIARELPRIMGEVGDMQAIELTPDEKAVFAKAAMSLKFDESLPVEPFQVLAARRYGDQKPDLWTTFNVIQENLTKGGLRYMLPTHITEDGTRVRARRAKTREIKSIREDTKLNKALWMLAEEMKRLKLA